MEHFHTALFTKGNADSRSAAATCIGDGAGGGGGASRCQSRVLQQSEEHFHITVVTDGSADSRSAADTCIGVTVDAAAVVPVDGIQECYSSRRSILTQQPVEHFHTALVTDSSADSRSAADTCMLASRWMRRRWYQPMAV